MYSQMLLLQFFFLIWKSVFLIYYLYQYNNCKAGNTLMICVSCSAIVTPILFVRGLVHNNAG